MKKTYKADLINKIVFEYDFVEETKNIITYIKDKTPFMKFICTEEKRHPTYCHFDNYEDAIQCLIDNEKLNITFYKERLKSAKINLDKIYENKRNYLKKKGEINDTKTS